MLKLLALASILNTVPLLAHGAPSGGVTFEDIVADPASGVAFSHVEPPRNAILDGFKANGINFPDDLLFVPHKPHGAPGVAIFDFDRDGDLDIYVTNSVGGQNALFSNQRVESGGLSFSDVAVAAGVDAADHDSTGVCYGDIDNDGDHDLMVLGAIEPNRLYENQGDGTFVDISATAGIGGGNLSTSSCSMGDVDNDGLLDIAVANTHTTWNDLLAIFVPFTFNEHNQLFRNLGGNVFQDTSAAAGFETLDGLPPGAAALTWAIALADYDLDGDVDAFTVDDQGAVPPPAQPGGVDYGIIHLHVNDGTGSFTDVAVDAGFVKPGNWMGLAFGDLDCDDDLDVFVSNTGDFPPGNAVPPPPLGERASRWFLQEDDGTWSDPGVGPLVATPFGWGSAINDYDNDGDPDILFHGGIDVGNVIAASNPGTILSNQGCSATFTRDAVALANGANHLRRTGQGLATGDLDGNGFIDIVTVSNSDNPTAPLVPLVFQPGSPFDDEAFIIEAFSPDPADPARLLWNGFDNVDGSLAIEMSSGGNGNHSASVSTLGTIGITSDGTVNRDGIGAVVRFSTHGGKSALVPVLGGSSYASQHALEAHLGFGRERRGTVEVLWPGGVRNRLFGVRAGERLVFPEIPCDLDTAFADRSAYVGCVVRSLGELRQAGVISFRDKIRFLISALLP